jgi:alpha-tubulin suppressor-like RCC1 family protein
VSLGALGQGELNSSELATTIPSQPAPGFISVGLGPNNACGVTASEEAYCWGNDVVLEALGSGERETPFAFPALDGSRQIALSARLGFALDAASVVRVFGSSGAITALAGLGESVVGTDIIPLTPISGLNTVRQVVVGANLACALQVDNTVWCWGLNNRGQLGNGSTLTAFVPVQVSPTIVGRM